MKVRNGLVKIIFNLDWIITSIALIILICVTFTGVIARYFLNDPIIWIEEVQLWCFIWIVFFGGGAAFRTGSHVAIDVFVELFPEIIQKIIQACVYVIVMLILAYFTVHGNTLVQQLIRTQRVTNILKIPYGIIYSAFPIGCILMMISYTAITIDFLLLKEDGAEGGQ